MERGVTMTSQQKPEDHLAEKLTIATNFPKICRKAVQQLGIYYDNHKYWWIWNENQTKWQETDETDILNKIDTKIKDSANTIEPKIKTLLLEALKREGRKNKPQELDWHWIQFQDTLINFNTKETMKATSKYFNSNPIPWKIGKTTNTPKLDKLLDQWLNNKKTTPRPIETLKDLFAFSIVPHYFISTVPFLYGKGSDGKTQYINTLTKFIGDENHTSTTLHYLEKSQFGTYSLRKKLLATINELPKNKIDQFTNIKSISGRDGKTFIEKKGHDRTKEKIYAKIILVGNNVPICDDTSDGFFRRISLINFPNTFEEKGDVYEAIPDKEFENLCLWSLQKLKELTTTYKLTCNQDNLIKKREEYKKASNQVIHFMESVGYKKTGCMEDSLLVTQWYDEFNRWAEDNNLDLLDYKQFKAKIENLGITTENAKYEIREYRTMRLFAYGIKKVVLEAKGD